MEKVVEFLKKAETYYLATIDGDQARVRPFGTVNVFEGKLYIQTGKGKDVAEFHSSKPQVADFLDLAGKLVSMSIKEYPGKNYNHLEVCFGCTGGQHRSVYAAQHLAEHVYKKFNVRVELSHREQSGHDRTFNPVQE